MRKMIKPLLQKSLIVLLVYFSSTVLNCVSALADGLPTNPANWVVNGDSVIIASTYPLIILGYPYASYSDPNLTADITYTNTTSSAIHFSYSWSPDQYPSDNWGYSKCQITSNLDDLLNQNGGTATHTLGPGSTLTFHVSVSDCGTMSDIITITFNSPLAGQSASAIALTSSAPIQQKGQGNVIAVLTDTNGAPVSGKTITFQAGNSGSTPPLGTAVTDSTGTATLSTARLNVGSYSIVATYDGDAAYAYAIADPLAITIVPDITSSSLNLVFSQDGGTSWLSGGSVLLGRPLLLKASVSPAAATGAVVVTLTNTITSEIVTSPAQTVANGSATFATAPLTSLGSYTLQASFTASSASYSNSTSATLSLSTLHTNPLTSGSTGAAIMASARAVVQAAQIVTQRVSQRLERLHDDDVPTYSNGIGLIVPSTASGFSDVAKDYALRNTDAAQAIDKNFDNAGMGIAKGQRADHIFSELPFSVWTSGSVMFGHQSAADGGSNDHVSTSGLGIGADMQLMSLVKGGIAVSFSNTSTQLNGDGSNIKGLLVTGTSYASWHITDHVFIDTLLGYGDVRFSSHRYDSMASSFLDGNRTGSIIFGGLSLSYDRKIGALKYATYSRADFSASRLNAFNENGDRNYTLALQKIRFASQSTSIGLRGQYDFAMSWGIISPLARLEYSHIFNGRFLQNISYVNDPGTIYALNQASNSSNVLNTELGLRITDTHQVSTSLSYNNTLSVHGIQSQGYKGAIQLQF